MSGFHRTRVGEHMFTIAFHAPEREGETYTADIMSMPNMQRLKDPTWLLECQRALLEIAEAFRLAAVSSLKENPDGQAVDGSQGLSDALQTNGGGGGGTGPI